jgi:septum formation protein
MVLPCLQSKPNSLWKYFCLVALTPAAAAASFVAPYARRHFSSIIHMKSDPLQELGLPGPLILGSGSFTRKLILKEMGIDFVVIKRPIDEKGLGDREKDTPHDLVLTLAKAKAHHLVSELKAGRCNEDLPEPPRQTDWIVLTGDQVVTHQGDVLEKPDTIEQAKDFCARYALAPPSTVGSCVLTHLPSMIQVAGVDSATIVFRPSVAETNPEGLDLVDRMLRDGAPVLDCAGGLMVEHPLVREHLERIEGTEDSVMGLSKELVLRLLKELKDKLTEQDLL